MPERITTQVGTRRITLSHLDKPLWPTFSKAAVLDYYLRVAEVLVPHTRRRPAAFVRTPDGPSGSRFFAQRAPEGLPDWIPTAPNAGRDHVALDDTETLIAAVNAYCLEIHVPQWTADTGPDLHDRIVFDLDPGEGADLTTCCRVALMVRDLLSADHLPAFPVTTGGKGLHLYVGLARPWLVADAVGYAKSLAQRLSSEHRRLITHIRGANARAGGKVLVDWAQNHSRATTSAPYTLRVQPDVPTVSTPLLWEEVEAGDPEALDFSAADVLERVAAHGDLAHGLLDPPPF